MDDTDPRITDLKQQIERLWQQIEVKDSQIGQLHQTQESQNQLITRLASGANRSRRRTRSYRYRSYRRYRRSSSRHHRRPVYPKSEIEDLVQRDFPDWESRELQFVGQGSNFCTYSLNNEFIVRCCRELHSIIKLRREERLLPELQSEMTIPQYQHIGRMNNGLPYCTYRMIKGEPFDEEQYRRFSAEKREQAARTMASFLTKLHAYPVQEAMSHSIQFETLLEFPVLDLFEYAQQRVHADLPETEWDILCQWMDWYDENQDSFGNELRLVHGDLGPHHILCDEGKQEIAGVIDFSEIHMNDPGVDLCSVYETYGSDFWDRFRKHYHGSNLDDYQQKFAFIQLARTIEHFCHVSNDRREHEMEEILDELKRFLNDHHAQIS